MGILQTPPEEKKPAPKKPAFEHVEHAFAQFAGLIKHAIAGKVLELHWRLESAILRTSIIGLKREELFAIVNRQNQLRDKWRLVLVKKYQILP